MSSFIVIAIIEQEEGKAICDGEIISNEIWFRKEVRTFKFEGNCSRLRGKRISESAIRKKFYALIY